MPGKRPRADSHSDAISLVFEKLFPITDISEYPTRNTLKVLKRRLLSAEAEEEESIVRKAAKEFTLEEAVMDFGLTYTPTLKDLTKHRWKIKALPDVKTFQPSACLESVLENYIGIYDRTSKAGCRVAMDFLLCECIAVMRGTTQDGQRTPTLWDTVKVHCEVSFTHTMNPMPKTPRPSLSVVLITASELSSDPGRKPLIGSFTRSCSASGPNAMAALATL